MKSFTPGDVVTLEKQFWKFPSWTNDSRANRKRLASLRTDLMVIVNQLDEHCEVKVAKKFKEEENILISNELLRKEEDIIESARKPYTWKQIRQAKIMLAEILYDHSVDYDSSIHFIEFFDDDGYLDNRDRRNRGLDRVIALEIQYHGKKVWKENARAIAFCSPLDYWNSHIGRLVATCKLLKLPLPEWI